MNDESMKEMLHDHAHEHPDAAGIDRRSFLKLAGFSFAGVALLGCEKGKIEKAIPYLIQPEEVTPGKAYWYATTCGGCPAGCGVLVKNRDGRPVKMEGNPDHPVSRGGLCVIGQAMVLGLYDSHRLRGPLSHGAKTSWDAVDRNIRSSLGEIARTGGAVRLLSGSVTSPTAQAVIDRFLGQFRDGRHVIYEPLSCSAILDAHLQTHGARVLPSYRFDRAETIVAFDADFLGTWVSPVEFTTAYRKGRTLEGNPPRCSSHVQFESRLSVTGAKADTRHAVSPSELGTALYHLALEIEGRAGQRRLQPSGVPQHPALTAVARALWKAKGRSLVVCGTNRLDDQLLVNYINHLLGNYGTTVDLQSPSLRRRESDRDLETLITEMQEGRVSALFLAGVNPVYDLPWGESFGLQMQKIPLVVSSADRVDETAQYAQYVCPDHHPLESWADAEPVAGTISVSQPAIAPMGKTRSLTESLAAWMGKPASAREIMQEEWKRTVYPRRTGGADFRSFWDTAVHDGFVQVKAEGKSPRPFEFRALHSVSDPEPEQGREVVLYPKVALLAGAHAHNAWLQEVPDPISKIAWDNYASMSPAAAEQEDLEEGDVVRISVGDRTVDLPVHVQPGQHDATIAIALGYGRKGTDRFTNIGPKWFEGKASVGPNGLVGTNAAPMIRVMNGHLLYRGGPARLEKTGERYQLACTQTYHWLDEPSYGGGHDRRPFVQQTTLEEYAQNPSAGSHPAHPSHSMWPEQHTYPGHHWGMMIDLNACTGCSACVVSCQAENNIPVVGKDEVVRNREMHWIRIDRYYMEDGGDLTVAHQPMLCQHCDNAPCETVCPVLATVHSSEGLNQQVYNRCVGTRYCANNCPYKIRRFNWFDYPHEDKLQNMVLNPDVTVRSRGIMEKCSFCVQRIQEAKIEAKRTGMPLRDGAIQTACEQSCPADAIVFGDMNDPAGRVAALMKDSRRYRVLAELEVRPSVGYMTMVRNRPAQKGGKAHG